MSQQDVELVRVLLGPFEQGDISPMWRDDAIFAARREAAADLFTPDFECVFVREDVGRSTYIGLEGLRAFLDSVQGVRGRFLGAGLGPDNRSMPWSEPAAAAKDTSLASLTAVQAVPLTADGHPPTRRCRVDR